MWASTLPGLDRRSPQLYLRKWQSGPVSRSACLSISLSVSPKAQSPPSFLLQEWSLFSFVEERFISVPAGKKENTHTKRKVCANPVPRSSVLETWFRELFPVHLSLIEMFLCKLFNGCSLPDNNQPVKERWSLKGESVSLLEEETQSRPLLLLTAWVSG